MTEMCGGERSSSKPCVLQCLPYCPVLQLSFAQTQDSASCSKCKLKRGLLVGKLFEPMTVVSAALAAATPNCLVVVRNDHRVRHRSIRRRNDRHDGHASRECERQGKYYCYLLHDRRHLTLTG
jgi:hypothetical protein